MKRFLTLALISILSILGNASIAQDAGGNKDEKSSTITQTKMKVLYMMQFAKNIEWANDAPSEVFRIGVVENQEMFDQLNALEDGNKTIKDLPMQTELIQMKDLDNPEQWSKYHMLYYEQQSDKSIELHSKLEKGCNTFLVCEGCDIEETMANFVMADVKLRYELNRREIKKCDLKVSESLENIAFRLVD